MEYDVSPMKYEVSPMEYDVSEMDSWNALPGPLILCANATRIENIREIITAVKSNSNEGQHTNLKTVVRDISTKKCPVHHGVNTHTGGSSRVDSLCSELYVGHKCNCNVRTFACWSKRDNNATETTRGASHPASPPYVSREEMSEAHRSHLRKRGCRMH